MEPHSAVPAVAISEVAAEIAEAHDTLHAKRKRQAADETLYDSAVWLSEMTARLDLGAFMAGDPDGVIRYWSAGCERLYGWTAREAVGCVSHTLLSTAFPVPRAEIEAVLESQGKWCGELRQRRQDGTTVVVGVRKALHRDPDGRPSSVVEIVVDMTAQRQAEAALAKSEARLRVATAETGSGVFQVDLGCRAIWFDPLAAAMLGGDIPVAAWIPLDSPDYTSVTARIHPDDRADYEAALSAVTDGVTSNAAVEYRLCGADDVWRWIRCRALGVGRGTDPEDSRWLVGIVQDTTERDDLKAELPQAQQLQALGRLASGIVHDLNNVLHMVQSGAEQMDRCAENPATVRHYTRMISKAAARGAAVTHRLLAYVRHSEPRLEAVDPVELLNSLREILAPTLGSRIAVQVEAEPGLPPLRADRAQLETVLVNLAVNARDAMPAGGTMTLSAVEAPVEGAAASPLAAGPAPARYIRVSVRDNGAGMDTTTLARVAEPFFTTKLAGQGTGLGLAMAKGFVEQSGGVFAVVSEPDRGTVVRLWFPVAGNVDG